MKARVIEAWKRLPAPWRAGAHRGVQAVERALVPVWTAAARRGKAAPSPGDPVIVAGVLRSSIGIGQAARLCATALEGAAAPVRTLDLCGWAQLAPDMPPPPQPEAEAASPGVVISHINPPELERVLSASRAAFLRGRRHVGFWYWELPTAPARWRRAFRYVDAVWAQSTFTADALRALAPPGLPVHVLPHPVWAWPPARADREAFGLPLGVCLIFIALDLRSTAARKNPAGAIEAFSRARALSSSPARLLCKISGARAAPELHAALRAQVAGHDEVTFLDATLSQARMASLVASVDIVFSPHRAEGFGLLLAEGMRLGKAVVATGWSGNMDFMDADSAALIDHTFVPVVDPQGMYDGGVWAEPDLDHAARLLAHLIDDPQARAALGARAQARGGPVFDPAAWRALAAERLGELR